MEVLPRNCDCIVLCCSASYSKLQFQNILVAIGCIATIGSTTLRSQEDFSIYRFAVISFAWRLPVSHIFWQLQMVSSSFRVFYRYFPLSFCLHPFYSLSLFPMYVHSLYPMLTPILPPSGVACCNVRDDVPFSLMRYLHDFRGRLDARQFSPMVVLQDAQTARDELRGRGRGIAVKA